MKKIAIATLFAFPATLLAWDEYGALGARKLEVDAKFSFMSYTGNYDADGKKKDFEDGSYDLTQPALGVKYGLIDGLDVELELPFMSIKDDIGRKDRAYSGFGQPNIALKYTHSTGFGGIVAVDLPMASEEINRDPTAVLYAGLQYTKDFGAFALDDFIVYKTTLDEDTRPADQLWAYVKPQYEIADGIAPYLGVDYKLNIGKAKYEGHEIEAEGHLLTLKPGIGYRATDALGFEANVPVTVLGKNNGVGYGVYAGMYYTFGL